MDKDTLSDEDIIANIQVIENRNEGIPTPPIIIEDNVGTNIFGEKDYFTSFEVDEMGVTVLKNGSSITMIPAPDFLDTQVFHFYDDGTLALYVSVSNTIEGKTKYYFYKDKLIDIKQEVEEGINIPFKKAEEILARAKLVYNQYMK